MKKPTLLVALASLLCAAPLAQAIEVKFERDASVPIVYLNIAAKAGSVHDPKGQSGVSHFAAEMLKRGTKTRTKEQIDSALDQIGAHLEIETRTEAVILRGSVLSSELPAFMELVSDLITQPIFPEREIRKLKTETLSEILEMRGSDDRLAAQRYNKFLFNGHPYGNPIHGRLRDIEALDRAKIVAQYQRIFRDPNLLIVGSGDADESFVRTWAERLSEKRPANPKYGIVEKVDRPRESETRRLIIVDKPDRTQSAAYLGKIGMRMTDPDFFATYLGNHAFGGDSFTARMMVEIRAKRGWSYGAFSYFRHGLQPRSWQAMLSPAEKDTPDAIAYAATMIQDLKEKGVTKEEFEFAKRAQVNSAGFMFNTPKKRVENILLERTLDLPDGFMKTFGERMTAVNHEQTNEALKRFLSTGELTIVLVGTSKNIKTKLAEKTGIAESAIQVVPYTQE